MTPDYLRSLRVPGVTASIAAAKDLWPEHGVRILATMDCGLINYSDWPGDVRNMTFSGWSQSKFHYCPQAKWDDWVKLARLILKIDEQGQDGLWHWRS